MIGYGLKSIRLDRDHCLIYYVDLAIISGRSFLPIASVGSGWWSFSALVQSHLCRNPGHRSRQVAAGREWRHWRAGSGLILNDSVDVVCQHLLDLARFASGSLAAPWTSSWRCRIWLRAPCFGRIGTVWFSALQSVLHLIAQIQTQQAEVLLAWL